MNADYEDIRSLISQNPLWFDECAVPRYAPFEPELLANIYAFEAALVEIACQNCGRAFSVAFAAGGLGRAADLADRIRSHDIHYGDPPNIGCCGPGPAMNSVPKRVLQYWERYSSRYTAPNPDVPGVTIITDAIKYDMWGRVPELEIAIQCDWASGSQE